MLKKLLIIAVGGSTLISTADAHRAAIAPVARGTIKGHVRLTGKLPGNPIIRMGLDPVCATLNAEKRPVQEVVAATLDGSLANAFVKLQGAFEATPVPADLVTVDQRACLYAPRVVGARVGQILQVRNSDDLLHNVHSLSGRANTFNVSEPKAGMTQQFRLREEEIFRLKCDIHSWMTAYVGVVNHPYFTVSDGQGIFEIRDVPAGVHTIEAWHERYGQVSQSVRVSPGTTAVVDFSFKP